GIGHHAEEVLAQVVDDQVVDHPAVLVQHARVQRLAPDLQLVDRVGEQVAQELPGALAVQVDHRHVADVEHPGVAADVVMLLDQLAVVEPHVPSADVAHPRAERTVAVVEDGFTGHGDPACKWAAIIPDRRRLRTAGVWSGAGAQATEASTASQSPSPRPLASSSASRFCSSCSTRLAPRITEDTRGLRRHQAIASGAAATPASSATRVKARARWSRWCSSATTSLRSHSRSSRARRESPGMPSLYLPVSRPEASGDQTVVPIPNSRYSGAYSCSTRSRCSRLYCGCSMVGACRWWRAATACAWRINSADHSEVPQYRTFPCRISVSIAHTVSSTGTSGSGRWQ